MNVTHILFAAERELLRLIVHYTTTTTVSYFYAEHCRVGLCIHNFKIHERLFQFREIGRQFDGLVALS